MRSNYKKLGLFINKVDKRNKDLSVDNLRGLSMTKEFRDSTSNIVGTDMSKYKIVEQWQFACDFMSVIRVHAFPVVLNKDKDPVLVSPAYPIFKIIDNEELDPEYLMMWFRRSEFDRYADFKCDSAIRGGFGWEELCDIELPVPSTEKQREIVREYNVVNDRIALNEKLTQKLEDTAQVIYKQWFVDFEFPISKEYSESIGKPELEGKPYKSSGGKMEYCDLAEILIPQGWGSSPFTQLFNFGGGGTPSTVVPEYWNNDIFFFTGRDVKKCYYTLTTGKSISTLGLKNSSAKLYSKNTTFIVSRGATAGATALAGNEMAMNQSCYAVVSGEKTKFFTHQTTLWLIKKIKKAIFSGAIFNALVTKDFEEQLLPSPPSEIQEEFHKIVQPLYARLDLTSQEDLINKNINSLILSKMSKA